MPNKNATGPNGEGSRTGRGLGNCGNNNPETDDTDKKRVFGQRNGQGRKMRGQNQGQGQGQGRGRG